MKTTTIIESAIKEKEKIDHDQLFKTLIKEFFKEFMELFFADIAARIDFSHVEFLDKEHFTDTQKGKHRYMDFVAKVMIIAGGEEYILIHTEFESTRPIRSFPEKMFKYYCQLYLRMGLPIIPIVVFSDDAKWRTLPPQSFTIAFNKQRYLDFFFHRIKLKNMDWKQFLKQNNPLAYALMAKMDIDKKQKTKLKADFLRLAIGSEVNPARESLLVDFIENYIKLNSREQKEFDALVQNDNVYKEVIKMMTVYEERGIKQGMRRGIEQGIQQGIQRGIEQGMQQGIQQGIEQGMQQGTAQGIQRGIAEGEVLDKQNILIRQIERKYGALAVSDKKYIKSIRNPLLLDKALDEILFAESKEAIFAIIKK